MLYLPKECIIKCKMLATVLTVEFLHVQENEIQLKKSKSTRVLQHLPPFC